MIKATGAAALAGWLAGCGPHGAGAPGDPGAAASAEASYRAPPAVLTAARGPGGRIRLTGSARPGMRVRLASPAGAAAFAPVDAQGDWRAVLAAPAEVRLFGVSMIEGGRAIQSEGYLAVTPGGATAQLRAGSGAQVIGSRSPGPTIAALDFDRRGGAVVSGFGAPKETLAIRADGATRGSVVVGADGRYSMALNEPLAPGDHRLEAVGKDGHDTVAVSVSPPQSLTLGPFRAAGAGGGWRIDWLTPGGGLQTTILFDGRAPAA